MTTAHILVNAHHTLGRTLVSTYQLISLYNISMRFVVVQSLRLTLRDPMDCSAPGFSVLHYRPEFSQIRVHQVDDANDLIFCYPLLLLPSIFPSIRLFSNESALPIRWPKHWSFSFSLSPSSEVSSDIVSTLQMGKPSTEMLSNDPRV